VPEAELVAEHVVALDGKETCLEAGAYLVVDNPRLWWTHDLGEPAFYSLRISLSEDGAYSLAHHGSRVGIRTLELDQSPDPAERGARFFRFILNGRPIFARGANWVLADSFVGAIEKERYGTLIGAAKDANMNMLRVWGGGVYERDAFYELCDELGLLVWQDFMFACATYPEKPPRFVSEVEAEARYQVRRLRSHPCLALWCGNNENQWIHDRTFWDDPDNRVPGSIYYDEVLPGVVAELDGRTPYRPGSPYGGSDHNAREEGNVHNWDVWHGNPPAASGRGPAPTLRRRTSPFCATPRTRAGL
jgi:beta-mannosidase